MDNKQISCVAAASGTSKATVSKVLNHCYGVSAPVRQKVFAEADKYGLQKAEEERDLYIIFSGDMEKRKLPDRKTMSMKYNICSHWQDEATLLRYLEQAERVRAKVILLATDVPPAVIPRLEELAKRCLVIFLGAYNSIKNAFFVGSDPVAEGALLASACRSEGQWLLLTDGSSACQKRFRGFTEALGKDVQWQVVPMEPEQNVARLPSVFARTISQHITPQHCGVVCLNADTGAVCAAIRKLKLPQKLSCMGVGVDGLEERWASTGVLKAAVYANETAQLEQVMRLAKNYICAELGPKRKFLYEEPELRVYG